MSINIKIRQIIFLCALATPMILSASLADSDESSDGNPYSQQIAKTELLRGNLESQASEENVVEKGSAKANPKQDFARPQLGKSPILAMQYSANADDDSELALQQSDLHVADMGSRPPAILNAALLPFSLAFNASFGVIVCMHWLHANVVYMLEKNEFIHNGNYHVASESAEWHFNEIKQDILRTTIPRIKYFTEDIFSAGVGLLKAGNAFIKRAFSSPQRQKQE